MEPRPAPSTAVETPDFSRQLRTALDRAWARLVPDPGLLPELPFDAVAARAAAGERGETAPRLLELIVAGRATVEDAARSVADLGRHPWPPSGRAVVEDVLDAWWEETLVLEPGEHRHPFAPGVVLGVLAGYDAPMVRWLGPWLQALDGPGASHLAGVVLDGLDGPAWTGNEDRAAQVQGWARTDAVVNGLTLIGGVHLDHEVLSDVLDRLI